MRSRRAVDDILLERFSLIQPKNKSSRRPLQIQGGAGGRGHICIGRFNEVEKITKNERESYEYTLSRKCKIRETVKTLARERKSRSEVRASLAAGRWITASAVPSSDPSSTVSALFSKYSTFIFHRFFLTKRKRNSDFGMHEQTDLVEL